MTTIKKYPQMFATGIKIEILRFQNGEMLKWTNKNEETKNMFRKSTQEIRAVGTLI